MDRWCCGAALPEVRLVDINTPLGASICTSILTFKETDDVGGADLMSPGMLFAELLNRGLTPNMITFTAIIRSMCVVRDLSTAWQVFELARQYPGPDVHLHSTMLNGAKQCGNLEIFRDVAAMAIDGQFYENLISRLVLEFSTDVP